MASQNRGYAVTTLCFVGVADVGWSFQVWRVFDRSQPDFVTQIPHNPADYGYYGGNIRIVAGIYISYLNFINELAV